MLSFLTSRHRLAEFPVMVRAWWRRPRFGKRALPVWDLACLGNPLLFLHLLRFFFSSLLLLSLLLPAFLLWLIYALLLTTAMIMPALMTPIRT